MVTCLAGTRLLLLVHCARQDVVGVHGEPATVLFIPSASSVYMLKCGHLSQGKRVRVSRLNKKLDYLIAIYCNLMPLRLVWA